MMLPEHGVARLTETWRDQTRQVRPWQGVARRGKSGPGTARQGTSAKRKGDALERSTRDLLVACWPLVAVAAIVVVALVFVLAITTGRAG